MSSDGDTRPRSLENQATVLFRSLPDQPKLSVATRKELAAFARALGEQVSAGSTFDCLITDDRQLQQLNRSFLGLDYPTDVLSFPSGASTGVLGEIAISLQRAEAQAEEFGHTVLDEIRILMLHGLLHLHGFNHEHDRGEMARAERKWRTILHLPNTLIARTRHTQEAG